MQTIDSVSPYPIDKRQLNTKPVEKATIGSVYQPSLHLKSQSLHKVMPLHLPLLQSKRLTFEAILFEG